jgi:hypothetical protein
MICLERITGKSMSMRKALPRTLWFFSQLNINQYSIRSMSRRTSRLQMITEAARHYYETYSKKTGERQRSGIIE